MKKKGKRARRRQRAQESMETEIPPFGYTKESGQETETGLRRGGQEVLFALNRPETVVIPSSGCEITGMVRILNSAIATVSQDTARIH